jgi:hypothetical protein
MRPDPVVSLLLSLKRVHEIPEADESVAVHPQFEPLWEMPQNAGHRSAEPVELLSVHQKTAFIAANGARIGSKIPVFVALFQHDRHLGLGLWLNLIKAFP